MGFERFKGVTANFEDVGERKPTDKQKSFIEAICELLEVEFNGTSFQDASDFISKYSKEFYRTKNRNEREKLLG
jgi:hypothetical protein